MIDGRHSASLEDRLTSERNVWLATVRPDGRPHITPIWFVYVSGRFWIGTGASNVKTRNVATNPAVSVALEDGDDPVVVEGVAHVHHRHRPRSVADAFKAKYEWDVSLAHDPDVGTVVLWEIEPIKWLFTGPSS